MSQSKQHNHHQCLPKKDIDITAVEQCVAVADNNTKQAAQQETAPLSGLSRTGRKIPPLDTWHPEVSGEMDLVIKANGEWWHEGARMTRQKLVNLFATILWREQTDDSDRYYLKSPVEKIGISVEDVPLLAVEVVAFEEAGQAWLQFTTQTGDVINASATHPIVMRAYGGEMRPYIRVRSNLDALIHRNTFYHLVSLGELSEKNGDTLLTLCSGGATFHLLTSTDAVTDTVCGESDR